MPTLLANLASCHAKRNAKGNSHCAENRRVYAGVVV